MIEDCLHKDPQQRPPHATAVALRLGLGDNEVMGLGLGLVWSADDRAPAGQHGRYLAQHDTDRTERSSP